MLWLTGEHYARQKPLSYHAERLPRDVTRYADPSGANERCELRWAGFAVREGDDALRPGIAAVSARLENGTLRGVAGSCPNLLAEAELYRYADGPRTATPQRLPTNTTTRWGALRYLISKLDAPWMARQRHAAPGPGAARRAALAAAGQ